ncbi:hyoscyamine 6-dioxygenase-like [Chenopodium quinoa]|uniref:hyoscyamine 6-dioxygenase-like n=1 Tax=Chenopodium quinoa TaxID=63459 RepID=UPI000B77C24D|nr:hyoscyamine 6-dioxygenase-like [Chenopodium quinoa]
MANLLSDCFTANGKTVENYVFPPERRPPISGKVDVPIIDLQEENSSQHIMKAIQEFGLFQVINHGVSKDLIDEALKVFKEVFELPPEEKSKINMEEDLNQFCRIYSSSYNFNTEKFHYWRDVLKHHCSPLEECIKFWPQNPENYREIVGAYVTELKDLGARILECISEGIGLEKGYFASELSADNILTVNHYPPCSNPSLTLGLTKHSDPNLITILQAVPLHVPGLELFKNGQWMSVDTVPDAFVVFVGNQLEVVSNGELKAAVHRVSNATEARTSAAFFINPSYECIVEPAKELVQAEINPPLFKAFKYKDFFKVYTGHDGERHAILEDFGFKIKP